MTLTCDHDPQVLNCR